jgi:hypothetical protein
MIQQASFNSHPALMGSSDGSADLSQGMMAIDDQGMQDDDLDDDLEVPKLNHNSK